MRNLLIITFYWKSEKSVAKMRWVNLSLELKKLKYKVFVLTFGDDNKIEIGIKKARANKW